MSEDKTVKVSKAIKGIVQMLMERVMNRVLKEDPFISEIHRANKPLYAALVPDEIFKGSHFERRFVTPFGSVWENLAKTVGEVSLGRCRKGYNLNGNVGTERLRRIQEVLNTLEHSAKGEKKVKPNWDKEIAYILEGQGDPIPTIIVCDLFVENTETNEKFAFELKAPMPNSDQTKVSKEKIFKLYAMEPKIITEAYYALPYNPWGKRENYNWAFPARWFNMKEDKVVLIGDEFWDKIGGEGTYKRFISEINSLGKEYRERIYIEYLGIEPPKGFDHDILI